MERPARQRGRRRAGVAVQVLVGLAVVATAVVRAAPHLADRVGQLARPSPSEAPSPPAPMHATFDDAGRPFDVALQRGFEVVREDLVELTLPSGWLSIAPGESLPWLRMDDPNDVRVDLGVPGAHLVEVVWLQPDGEPDGRRPAGLVIHATDAPVRRWERFEFAYGTDGGMGAVTTPEYQHRNDDMPTEELEVGAGNALVERFIDSREPIVIDDLDGVSGPDTLVFDNVYGDGGYPMSRGMDANGRLAAVAIWHTVAPWRLAIPEGEPPPDVTAREAEIIECLAGRREVTQHGSCTSGPAPTPGMPLPQPPDPSVADREALISRPDRQAAAFADRLRFESDVLLHTDHVGDGVASPASGTVVWRVVRIVGLVALATGVGVLVRRRRADGGWHAGA